MRARLLGRLSCSRGEGPRQGLTGATSSSSSVLLARGLMYSTPANLGDSCTTRAGGIVCTLWPGFFGHLRICGDVLLSRYKCFWLRVRHFNYWHLYSKRVEILPYPTVATNDGYWNCCKHFSMSTLHFMLQVSPGFWFTGQTSTRG